MKQDWKFYIESVARFEREGWWEGERGGGEGGVTSLVVTGGTEGVTGRYAYRGVSVQPGWPGSGSEMLAWLGSGSAGSAWL